MIPHNCPVLFAFGYSLDTDVPLGRLEHLQCNPKQKYSSLKSTLLEGCNYTYGYTVIFLSWGRATESKYTNL